MTSPSITARVTSILVEKVEALHPSPAHNEDDIFSFHFEGEAQLWFIVLQRHEPHMKWEDFKLFDINGLDLY